LKVCVCVCWLRHACTNRVMDKASKKHQKLRENRKIQPKVECPSVHLIWERWHLRRWMGVALVLLAVPLSVLGLNRLLTVKHWDIEAPKAVQHDVSLWLGKQNLDFWHARSSLLREQILQRMPDVADVLLERQLPQYLHIQIRMRQALALWEDSEQKLYLVDEQGVIYRKVHHGEYVDLPLLRMPQKQVRAASHILMELKRDDARRWGQVSEMMAEAMGWRIDFAHQEQWLLPFGKKAVHNTAFLAQMLQGEPWSAGHWRIQSRLDDRWFVRPVHQKGGHPVGEG